MTPNTPWSVSMSVGAPPDAMVAATEASTKTWFPVPIRRLIVLLPVLAVKTYFPALVDQQSAAWLGVDDGRERAVAEQSRLAGMRERDHGRAVWIDRKAERRQRAGRR